MNFPGSAHTPSTSLSIKVYAYVIPIIAGIATLGWNIYTSITKPLPPEVIERSATPFRSSSYAPVTGAAADIVSRDLDSLAHGQILGKKGDAKLENSAKQTAAQRRSRSITITTQPVSPENYYSSK